MFAPAFPPERIFAGIKNGNYLAMSLMSINYIGIMV
jgi:hypothetical protein